MAMDCTTASSPVQDVAMTTALPSPRLFVDGGGGGGSSQESISMQCSGTTNSPDTEGSASDVTEERRDPALPTPLGVKIADLGNACWVVSCGRFIQPFSADLRVCVSCWIGKWF